MNAQQPAPNDQRPNRRAGRKPAELRQEPRGGECFPRAAAYRAMGCAPSLVRESRRSDDGFPYTERHIQGLWYDAAWRPACLLAEGGAVVSVEDPGRWNTEEGPDFLGARLIVGREGRRVCGDIEIHVHPHDWLQHGHGDDGRYRGVVAHVTYFPATPSSRQMPRDVLQIPLKPLLGDDPAIFLDGIDPAAYPHAALDSRNAPCAEGMRTLGPAARGSILDAAGEERLRIKTARIAAAVEARGEAQVFYEEVLCALGYKHNRRPCRLLARRVPLDRLREEAAGSAQSAYAVLLGVAGLLPQRMGAGWDGQSRKFVRSLWDVWWKRRSAWQAEIMTRGSWHLGGLRPQNHPLRRLSAAAAIFGAPGELLSDISAVGTTDDWYAQVSEQVDQTAAGIPYWQHRLSFSSPAQERPIALIGSQRIASLITNVVVPLLAARGRTVAPLLDGLAAEQSNVLTRQMAATLFGRDHNPVLYCGALRQQGLLQIFHDFCLQNRTGCRDCAFADALRKTRP